jgi:hypothetical protein
MARLAQLIVAATTLALTFGVMYPLPIHAYLGLG